MEVRYLLLLGATKAFWKCHEEGLYPILQASEVLGVLLITKTVHFRFTLQHVIS